jgi:nucleoside-diphosphate-sugar epimerase
MHIEISNPKKTALVTGGSGFFGGILVARLLREGYRVVSIDLQADDRRDPNFVAIQGDIRNRELVEQLYSENSFDVVYHCAAILAHAVKDENFLWTSNVSGTEVVAQGALKCQVPKLVFISSNCLWGKGYPHPITEDEPPAPIELYGRSKWEGEKIVNQFRADMDVVTIRCPTITDSGRLGLLSILFEFIDEGRKVWTVGGGTNRYQFIYAQDLADACLRAAQHRRSDIFNIGSDGVKTMAEVYQYVIARAGTGARLAALPKGPTLLAMQIAHRLKVSPLGPYHYKMIAENFLFDTNKIKSELGWHPTLTNEEMLYEAYRYYQTNRRQIEGRTGVSAHKQAADMGIIRVLKWFS